MRYHRLVACEPIFDLGNRIRRRETSIQYDRFLWQSARSARLIPSS